MYVIRRHSQKNFVVRNAYSSFTIASFIPDEKHDTLRTAIISDTSLFRTLPTTVHVDSAPGFQTLHNDKHLQTEDIQLEYGHIKNPNKNAVIDKGIQELELELLKVEPSGSPVSKEVLQTIYFFFIQITPYKASEATVVQGVTLLSRSPLPRPEPLLGQGDNTHTRTRTHNPQLNPLLPPNMT